ncbi:MAG TPA: GntR family transcriptional regulator [Ilumatobacter sp.]|nr:GntR family transcriptional regulator [Ilumatobacter sp.]
MRVDSNARRPPKASERIASQIVRDVMGRGLRAGDRLPPEAKMVEKYGVSRASLREALRLLEVQGLLTLKPGPGGGPVIGVVSPSNLARTSALYFHLAGATYQQLLATQALLESQCAGLACAHPDRERALSPFLEVVDVGVVREYRGHTEGFHEVVWRLAENPVHTLLSRAITHLVTDHVVATMDPLELRLAILAEHVELASVIIAGDAPKAQKLMAAHFEAQHAYYAEHWPNRLQELIEWR